MTDPYLDTSSYGTHYSERWFTLTDKNPKTSDNPLISLRYESGFKVTAKIDVYYNGVLYKAGQYICTISQYDYNRVYYIFVEA